MESIDNDFAHNRNLRSDCNNYLHMPQSWVVMGHGLCKKYSTKYIQDDSSEIISIFHLIWITLGKYLVKLAPRTPLNACLVDLRIATCLPGGGKWWLVNKAYRPISWEQTLCFRWRTMGLLIQFGVRIVWARVTWTKNVGLRNGNTSSALD